MLLLPPPLLCYLPDFEPYFFQHADKPSGRLLLIIQLFLPEFACGLCKPLWPVALASRFGQSLLLAVFITKVLTTTVHRSRYASSRQLVVWTSPEDSIHNLVLELPLSVPPPYLAKYSWLTLI